jgi:hypothetical protein
LRFCSVEGCEMVVQEDRVDPDEQDEQDIAFHREMDRIIGEWDDEPTHEKWRRGPKWN